MSILAMDAYNRSYGEGLKVSTTQVGLAVLGVDSRVLGETPPPAGWPVGQPYYLAQSYGFFAQSYRVGSEFLISYRGTDNYAQLAANDVLNGWVTGAGLVGTQAQFALDFYKAVVQGDGYAPTNLSTLSTSNVTFTGHSLMDGPFFLSISVHRLK